MRTTIRRDKCSFRMNILLLLVLLCIQIKETLENGLTSVEFVFTGDVQYFTVPKGVSQIYLDIRGGSGGTDNYGSPEYVGGFAAHVQTQLNVVPETTYYIFIGGEGSSRPQNDRIQYLGGYNGGGNSGLHEGAGGGGASDFRTNSSLDALDSRIVIAGGGGGGSIACGSIGGNGGFPGGELSVFTYDGCPRSALTAGNQTQGGQGGTGYGYSGSSGSIGKGGDGYSLYGGGGGGGYYGGGGGAYGGGAGGSSFCNPQWCNGVYHTVSGSRGNGSALITFTEDHRTEKLRTTNPRLRMLHG